MKIMRKTLIGSSIFFLVLVCTANALALKESVDAALKNNPSVLAGQKKLDAANARLGQAVGTFMPTLKLQGSYGRSWSAPQTVQITYITTQGSNSQDLAFGVNDPQNMRSVSGSVSQPLFVAALFPGYSIAKKSADLADEDLKKTVLDTSFNATQTYFNVIRAGETEKLAEESKQMAQSHLDQVKAMLSAGVVTRADSLRAEVQVANADVGITRAKNALNLAKDAFNNALGRDLESPVELEQSSFTGKVGSIPQYKELLTMAFDNRPDWRQYLLSRGIGEENLKAAQAAYLPTAMLNATAGNQVSEYPQFRSDVNSWSVVGSASWTLFDGLGIQNRISEAAANLDTQKATEEQVKNGVALEVRDSYLNLNSAIETIGSVKKAVDSAEENYKVSNLRYNSGVGTNLEVLDAQVALTQAKVNYLQALFDVEIAKAKINKVVGKEVL